VEQNPLKKNGSSRKSIRVGKVKIKVMSMNWYQCEKCGEVVKSEGRPGDFKPLEGVSDVANRLRLYAHVARSIGRHECPEGFDHEWINLGEVGPNEYQCQRCGIIVQTKSAPSSSGCQRSSFHLWTKL
jgi:DNA-directed RNA polymerase subunit RPC12/RpoP